jgi:hypothetical protein
MTKARRPVSGPKHHPRKPKAKVEAAILENATAVANPAEPVIEALVAPETSPPPGSRIGSDPLAREVAAMPTADRSALLAELQQVHDVALGRLRALLLEA